MDCSPPGSSIHEIPQARILEWVAISSSREFSRPRVKSKSLMSLALTGGSFTTSAIWEATHSPYYDCNLQPVGEPTAIWGEKKVLVALSDTLTFQTPEINEVANGHCLSTSVPTGPLQTLSSGSIIIPHFHPLI